MNAVYPGTAREWSSRITVSHGRAAGLVDHHDVQFGVIGLPHIVGIDPGFKMVGSVRPRSARTVRECPSGHDPRWPKIGRPGDS
jgi:hypothetical protein